ncbi:MAG: universal stress protein [Gemmatimonadota bacterium]
MSTPAMGRILVPLDGSRFGEQALPRALALASSHGAVVDLVVVAVPPEAGWPPSVEAETESLEKGSRERAERGAEGYLQHVLERIREAGLMADLETTVLPSGNVAASLVRHAEETGADLTVMTTHGRGPLRRAWLGSTADALLRRSPGPILLIPVEESSDGDVPVVDFSLAPAPFRRVVVPLDGSRSPAPLLPLLTPLLDPGAETILLRAVPPLLVGGSPYVPHLVHDERTHERFVEGARMYLDGIAEDWPVGAGVRRKVVTAMQAGMAILEVVEEEEADLVAMTTSGRSGVSRMLLGSVADKVLRGSPVPVLLRRDPGSD